MGKRTSQRQVSKRKVGAEPLCESAYRDIRSRILDRRVLPGQPVIEGRLAEEMGVSRTPVREALKKLVQEGLLTLVPGKGFFVESLSPGDVAEVYDIREMMEGLAARLLARWITPEQAQALTELSEKADGPSATIDDDVAFHSAIVDMCGSRRVADAARILSLHVFAYDERARRLTLNSHAPLLGRGDVPHAHRTVVEKIIAGDPREAEEAARAHVRLGKRTAAKYLLGIDDPF